MARAPRKTAQPIRHRKYRIVLAELEDMLSEMRQIDADIWDQLRPTQQAEILSDLVTARAFLSLGRDRHIEWD